MSPRPEHRPSVPRFGAAAAHLLFALLLALIAGATAAGDALEARVQAVAVQLRCPVCQTQTIADSQSGLALDIKGEIRERLRAGASVAEVTEHMVARYQDFVVYVQPVRTTGWLPWAAAAVLLLAGGSGLAAAARRRRGEWEAAGPAEGA